MMGNNQILKCLLSAFLIADLHVILSSAEDDTQQDTHFIKSRRSRLIHRSREDVRRISWPTGKAAMEYRRPPAGRRQQQQEPMERDIWEGTQDDQLHALLNCHSFSNVIRLLQSTELDLKSSLPKDDANTTDIHRFQLSRARLWVQRLHAQMRRSYRSCLPLDSLKSILEAQSGTFVNDQQLRDSQRPWSFAPRRKGRRKNSRSKHIPDSSERGSSVNTQASRSVPYEGSDSTNSRRNPSVKGDSLAVDPHYQRKVVSLSSELVRMVSRNLSLDIMKILQRLVDLEEEANPSNQLNSSNSAGENVTVEIGSMIQEVPPYFLSVAMAPRIIQNGLLHHITRSKKFLTLTRGLSPAVLRMGGSAANFLTYDTTNKSVGNHSNSNSGPVSHEPILNDERERGHFPQDNKPHPQNSPQSNKRSFAVNSQIGEDEEHNSTDISALELIDSEGKSLKESSLVASSIFSIANDEPRRGDKEVTEHEDGDDCVFDFKWHSFYKKKPNNDSTYDILAAVFSESEGDEHIRLQDQPTESDGNPCGYYGEPDLHNFTMEAKDWSRLTNFVESSGMSLLFDINQFYRAPGGEWDPTNAKMIIQEAASRRENILWQLGNEPNAYHFHYGYNFTGKRHAQDYHLLYKELKKVFRDPGLVGPDVTRPKHPAIQAGNAELGDICKGSVRFLEQFLRHLKVNLTALSWHQYYVNGQTATVEDFTTIDVLEQLSWQIPQIIELRNKYSPNTPVWLTETSSAWGGGADGLSNRYVAGFLWLDKLGMAAAFGIDMVARQTLIYGSYALVDSSFDPYPDYWLSLLFKTLVGERVLTLHITRESSPTGKALQTLRLYAHCQKSTSKSYKPGNVVIYGMNLGNATEHILLKAMDSNHTIEQYLLEPADNTLTSREVLLNGKVLQMISDEYLPELKPLLLPHQEFRIPPFTFGFWVINGTDAADCV